MYTCTVSKLKKVKVKFAQSCPTLCDPMDYTETSQFWSLTTPDMCTGNLISHVMDRSSALFGKPAEDEGATARAGLGAWPRTGPYDLTEAGRVHS